MFNTTESHVSSRWRAQRKVAFPVRPCVGRARTRSKFLVPLSWAELCVEALLNEAAATTAERSNILDPIR